MLSGLEIKRLIGLKEICIDPFDPEQLNPNSYNLRLGDRLLIYKEQYLDSKKNNLTQELEIPDEGFILHPGRIYLGSTIEYTNTPNHIPCIEGRSSLGRLGLDIHATAGFGDVGFEGTWTLELSVKQPLKIYPRMQIAQIAYHEITGEYVVYCGKYQGQTVPVPSRIHSELTQEGEKFDRGPSGAD